MRAPLSQDLRTRGATPTWRGQRRVWCALALLGALSGCATAAQRAERALDRGALDEAAAWLERAPGSFERSMIGADLALAREDVEAARRALELSLIHISEPTRPY